MRSPQRGTLAFLPGEQPRFPTPVPKLKTKFHGVLTRQAHGTRLTIKATMLTSVASIWAQVLGDDVAWCSDPGCEVDAPVVRRVRCDVWC
eukprot:1712595-Rhodomonas_salina.1